ncbi:hypothetical protein AVEN_63694-1 [Araneus ventricosus]|uniref:Tc1-like transposase DDE domain-containing protein n=1 Tax=Araneus ventricosus TaxID=182803 RepID=A0A4Y2JIY3_ARAVE|nr:hypothetical protein AVEN_63694-1 [Araneus ventricosus]
MIWREPGTRLRAQKVVERDHYRGGGLLVWAGISTNGRIDLYVFTGGSATAVRYRDEILHPLVWPFIAAMGTDAIFMDDNASPHRARLQSEAISQMAGPARSPNLNPIQHVWYMLGRRIAGRSVAPSTSSNKLYYRNVHYCHNKLSTTPLPACLAVVKHAFQLEGIIPVISVWFPLHILPTVIYVFLFAFPLLFDMWSSNAAPSSCTIFTHIH